MSVDYTASDRTIARTVCATIIMVALVIGTVVALRYVALPVWMAEKNLCERPLAGVNPNTAMAWLHCKDEPK